MQVFDTRRPEGQLGRPGRPGRDLGPIHSGSDLQWAYICQGVGAGDNRCRVRGENLSKGAATRGARNHLATEPTHRVVLTATTWQMVYGAQAR